MAVKISVISRRNMGGVMGGVVTTMESKKGDPRVAPT